MRKASFLIATLLLALWWGGFTFYASFVVPEGMKVLGNHIRMGLITQAVTTYLNCIGCFSLVYSGIALYIVGRQLKSLKNPGAEYIALVFCQCILLALHVKLSGLIVVDGQEPTTMSGFYSLHRIYLLTSTAVWLLIPVHFYRRWFAVVSGTFP
jgi:hypothetical protein